MSPAAPRNRTARAAWLIVAALLAAACSSGSDDATDDSLATPSGSPIQSVDTAETVPVAIVETTVPGTSAPSTTIRENTPTSVDAPPSTVVIDDGRLSLAWGVRQPDPNTGLDPVFAFDFGSYAVLAQMTEHLVATDRNGRPIPSLASTWTQNEDATVWTFELRPDVSFHDGAPFTALDVVESLERAVESGVASLDNFIAPGGIEAIDDATVVISTIGPTIDLPVRVSDSTPQTAILSEGEPPPFNGLLNGTGPFRLDSYDPLDGATFSANDEWWGGTPTVGNVDFRFFEFGGDAVDALRAGEVDGLAQSSFIEADLLRDDTDFTVATAPATNHRQIWMRTDEGVFADVRVRQAFALSLERGTLASTLFGDTARIGNDHPVDITNPGFDPGLPQRTNDDVAAQALLADAGFPDGLDVTLHVPDLLEIPILADLVAEQAASAGFRITVDVQRSPDFYQDSWCPDLGEERCNGDSFGIVDYEHRPTLTRSLGRTLTTGGVWNASNHADPEFDLLFARFEDAATEAERAAVTADLQRYLQDQVPAVVPYFFDTVYVHRSDLAGVESTAIGQPRLATAEQT